MTDSDSSDCDLLVQALPVPDMESDEPPDIQKAMASPEEYIRLVRYEAASYPSVLHAPIDAADVCPSPLTTNNNASVSPTFISNAYDELLTTFVDLVQEYRALKSLVTEDGKQPLSSDALENPNLLDQPPTFRWIAHLSRPELFAVLELVTSKCTKKRWKSSMAVWILSLMMALEPPLHPDIHHLLRTIARRCRKLKNELGSDKKSSEDDLFFGLCPILVARNFGQLDLLESP
ncbi:hypothetical protein CRM22_006762 [Opisthorchis felineus]|uniref:Gem-associated protein 2 n=1 Tax=Opisthorchis felineus TaxID=147828 RepID=A0A4S2LJM5_OPIFE|nr:hypothetical protein CRM22_006762 [Opisthorchis felineus]TGZ63711.1 hypothetical protein CRM22_006762 [Opisthorchis felineus]TGZ63712.1 hypothetical protein CRM22_006762 [Opisthorchis felineus]